ncbi:hypothetical protein B0A69_09050 [Chryseobacterium shigense]|nr:hypothetical protein [Chryseobacterium shigense]PQA94598.1 hypothetical protein B0A69_09050 [Chryseobacterium shigense]
MKPLNKVAAITLLFWLMKITATTLGETLGDFISMKLGLGYAVGIGITLLFFIMILSLQLTVKRYIPLIYWLVIAGTTTFGTEISDFIDRTLQTGYLIGSLILITGLLTTLFLWYRQYHTLEIYPVFEKKKEIYYWVAILFSNSLGTAFGDFLSDNLGYSYLAGAIITGIIILSVVFLHYFTRINHVLLFWIAFVFTRPFGATFGDFLTKPMIKGGLNLSTLYASLVSLSLLFLMIFISHQKQRKEFNQHN